MNGKIIEQMRSQMKGVGFLRPKKQKARWFYAASFALN
jgi:hypothetical protein